MTRFIAIGVDVNRLDASDHCAVGFASAAGSLECVEYLVQHGADINIIDVHGHAPLYAAATRGHLDITQFLVENGADITVKCVENGWTAAQWARHNGYKNMSECADYLDSLSSN